MGNSQSISENIYQAVKRDDVACLQSILQRAKREGGQQQILDRRLLEFVGSSGFTPLLVACGRGNTQCAELLLRYGANLRFFGPRPDCTTALHEAVLNQRTKLVELLLQFGADSYLENGRGLTAVDCAINTGNLSLLRFLERSCKFAAQLQVKCPRFGGLSSEWKTRWVTIMPRHPCPALGDPHPVVRTLLVAYKSHTDCNPCLKLWLNGAEAKPVEGHHGAQCALVLHPSHVPPTGAHITRDSTTSPWQLHFCQVDGTAGAQALNTFIMIVNDLNRRARPPVPGPGPSARPPAALPAPPAAAPASGAPANPFTNMPGAAAGSTADDAAMARLLQEQYNSEMEQYLGEQRRLHPNDTTAALMAKKLGTSAPPAAPASPQGPLSIPGSPGPLETHVRTSPLHGSNSNSYPTIETQGSARPVIPSAPPLSTAYPTLGSSFDHTTAPAAPASTSSSDPRQHFSPAWWESIQTANAPPPTPALGDSPMASTDPGSQSKRTTGDTEEGQCVVCMAEPASTGFTHGDSLHKCCCKECAQLIKSQGKACPMCRQKIEQVIYNFY